MSRVLVVDDDEPLRELLAQTISQLGSPVRTAHDVPSAIQVMSAEPVALVVADVKLPGQSGIELMKWVKVHHPTTNVVLVTSYPSVESAVAALHAGADDFIVRPFVSLEDIEKPIRRVLAQHARAAQVRMLTAHLERRYCELELLYKASNAISYAINAEVLVNLIMQSLGKLLPFDLAASLLTTPGRVLSVYLNGEAPDEAVEITRAQVAEAFSAMSSTSVTLGEYKLQVVRLGSVRPAGNGPDTRDTAQQVAQQTFFNVPIIVKGQPIGMISVSSLGGRRPFGKDELRLVATLATHVQLFVENDRAKDAMLAEHIRLEQQMKELEAMNKDLETMSQIMMDRETRITQLKDEVNALLKEQGKDKRYGTAHARGNP